MVLSFFAHGGPVRSTACLMDGLNQSRMDESREYSARAAPHFFIPIP